MNQLLEVFRRGWQNPWVAGQMLIWLLVVILSFVVALILYYTAVASSTLPMIAFFINAIAIFSGGYIAGKRARSRGWYFGGMQGAIYTFLLGLISFLAFDLEIHLSLLLVLIYAIGIGALGGATGVNTRED